MNNWRHPHNLDSPQRYLFKTPTEEVLAGLRVSHDEATRWFHSGWLSFSVSEVSELEFPLEAELRFVSSVARSGLSDAFTEELLRQLKKPYRYDPDAIAYSFSHGWVSPPQSPDLLEVVDENVDEWLESLAEDGETIRLEALHERIGELLEDAESGVEREAKS